MSPGRAAPREPGTPGDAAAGAGAPGPVPPEPATPAGRPAYPPQGDSGETRIGDADVLKEDAARRSGLRGWREGIRATPGGSLALKIVVGVIGAALVIGGLIMVPFPGPGWLVVFAGFAVLATEFAWAHRVLQFGKRTLASWTDWLKERGWTVRILVVGVTFLVAGAIIWAALKLSMGIDVIAMTRDFFSRP
ncbi:TIGR02611 family protein [Spongiactinospora sp. TRM90649]|uniref:TIGR02611 family protein n=1 Tax=Spongiactinospora sp. TRM90649 TaxID=3031114 RepID=UPI0023F67427|nr:TIGR02611 family protein [Spongiactinospora sp. TRM90649]MDF5755734.1 TIGR02611 family protein [Spongiactinospora sp. TRM90649]